MTAWLLARLFRLNVPTGAVPETDPHVELNRVLAVRAFGRLWAVDIVFRALTVRGGRV